MYAIRSYYELLQELGYKVISARSGDEAIQIYERNADKIDLILREPVVFDL